MTNSEKLISQWAEKYISLGWSLIPIKPRSKEPLIPWAEFQKRRATLTELETWCIKYPGMNLGVVTGEISNLFVVDADGQEGLKSLVQLQLTSSVIVLTGKGKQLYFLCKENTKNAVRIKPGIDIRAEGGFCVIPPSTHPNGKMYRWERFIPNQIPIFPAHLNGIGTNGLPQTFKEPGWIANGHKPGWISQALEEMKIGNIDTTLTSVCGRLRRDGYSQEDCFRLLEPHALTAGAKKGHLEEKIRNIWNRYEPKQSDNGFNDIRNGNGSIYSAGTDLSIHSPADDDSFNKFTSSMDRDTPVGTKTGFPTLDKYFEGGLKSERLFTIAARTGTGKTNFAIALASNLCQQGKKVLFFSTEFQYQKIWSRYIATLKDQSGFRSHSFHVCDSFSPRIEQVEEALKRIMPDVFIFDHINHIGEDRESLGVFMQGCNFLQRKYNCQGVMVAQLNRQADWVENGKRIEPRMSMVKGSGTIEQASSRVLLLSETRVTPEYNEILGVLDKNDSGDRGLVSFALYKNPYVFKELI